MKVFIIASLTADGYIGRHSKHLVDWSSKEDKQLFIALTKQAGVIVMGSNQFATIGRALPGRRNIVYTSRPAHITAEGVETTAEAPQMLLERLNDEGVEQVAICGGTTIYDMFMQAGLIDELHLTIEPIVFGSGLSLFSQPLANKLELLDYKKLNDHTLYAHYKVIK